MLSLQAQYAKEREGRDTLELEGGFATYVINKAECYIVDIYVLPEWRRSGLAKTLLDAVSKEASTQGCKYILGSVCPSANGATVSLKAMLHYGFELVKAENNMIWFTKEIDNG